MDFKDEIVVDGVVHAYNLDPEDSIRSVGEMGESVLYHRHANVYATPDVPTLTEHEMLRDWPAEDLERVLFLESNIDFAVYHHVRFPGLRKTGPSPLEKGLTLRERNPHRISVFGCVDPFDPAVEEEMEYQANEVGVDGFKFYPTRYRDGESLRVAMDDEETVRPLLDTALELGVSHVGVHKAIQGRSAPPEWFRPDDLYPVVADYPEIDFQVVHAGFAFLEDTVPLVTKFPNVYANLESTASMIHRQPREVAKVLGEIIMWGGEDKLLFSSSGLVCHPQSIIDRLWRFQIPADMRDEYGYPELTLERKRKLMGLNALSLLGISPDELRTATDGDQWSNMTAEDRPEPWSTITPRK